MGLEKTASNLLQVKTTTLLEYGANSKPEVLNG